MERAAPLCKLTRAREAPQPRRSYALRQRAGAQDFAYGLLHGLTVIVTIGYHFFPLHGWHAQRELVMLELGNGDI